MEGICGMTLFQEKGTTHPETILLRAEVSLSKAQNVVTARRGTHQKLVPVFMWHECLHRKQRAAKIPFLNFLCS